MEAVVLPDGCEIPSSAGRLAFIGLPGKRSIKQLTGSAERLMKDLADLLDEMLAGVIGKKTAKDFADAREQTFPSYAQVMSAASALIRVLVPRHAIERIGTEGFCEMEADFRDNAVSAFGSAMRDQAIFTIWTLRKIADLHQMISSSNIAKELESKDLECASAYSYHALRTRFHLDCLTKSMSSNLPIYPEVLEEISAGLRSAVDAYAWIRQGVDLRQKPHEPVLPYLDLDEEDQQFIEASARDMASESA